jgi:hypothetical protein
MVGPRETSGERCRAGPLPPSASFALPATGRRGPTSRHSNNRGGRWQPRRRRQPRRAPPISFKRTLFVRLLISHAHDTPTQPGSTIVAGSNIGRMHLRRITVSNVAETEKEMPECDACLRSKFWHDELLSLVLQSDVRSGSKRSSPTSSFPNRQRNHRRFRLSNFAHEKISSPPLSYMPEAVVC